MARQLLKLRYVPDDELFEIRNLLDENEIEYYETTAGLLGISFPALWLVHDEQFQQARNLLDQYAEQRLNRAKQEQLQLKSAGRKRSFLDMAKENPLRYVVFIICIIGVTFISIAPFISVLSVE